MDPAQQPTIRATIDAVLADVELPIARSELVTRVLERRPSSAKSARASVNNILRYEMLGSHLVELGDGRMVRTADVMRGLRYRHVIHTDERRHGQLSAYRCFAGYTGPQLLIRELMLEDEEGRTIPTMSDPRLAGAIDPGLDDGLDVSSWFRDVRMAAGDAVIVTILDWNEHRFRLAREPAIQANQAAIARRNGALCDAIFELLEHDASEIMWTSIALPTAYARLSVDDEAVGDHWLVATSKDPRLDANASSIRYGLALPDVPARSAGAGRRTPVVADDRVFRLAVRRPGGPRARLRLEVLGSSTIFDVDAILCRALNLDPWDHLRGFWRVIRRGNSKRLRKVEVATMAPTAEYCEGEDQPWSAVAPSVGDEIRFVYDFGDWDEFEITVEAVGSEPAAGVVYPRVVKGVR